ncbi:hypothetical protein N7466_008929 [Penicillium verhagenii]|uniref:uncharacterized protein n=1 Tax=Penicillium verhagenii TaxID=1562060 RepID=UPI002544F2FC|nr:uncharacterized protein N7466_008929 [Penicillium verhagenii]KAJ5924742.1 hypothetical protein N7466_008929 [Penicillium verhagenii]
MSTSRDRISLARHNYPQSPFNRAREPNYEFNLDTDNFPTPSKQNGSRPHHNYRTSTLAGAFRAVSGSSMEEGARLGSFTSPKQTREPLDALSPNSNRSEPPEELLDSYRRIGEDGSLADYVASDGWGASLGARTASRSPSQTRGRDYERFARHGLAISEPSLFSDAGRPSPRQRNTDYTKDEMRLRRVTGKDSPVFSKAKAGARQALTADNLQRREEEIQSQHVVEEEENNEFGPSLNYPAAWGSRASRRPDWGRKVSERSVSDPELPDQTLEERPTDRVSEPTSRTQPTDQPLPKPRLSSRSLERSRVPTRTVLEERTANPNLQDTQELQEKPKEHEFEFNQNMSGQGDPIPNTPIVVFKTSTFNRPSPSKRDSQDLLRRLSRAESPRMDQIQTPEQTKLSQPRIYDKTPRVTGAWIDTPMTAKVAPIPVDLTKDIVRPPAAPKPVEPSVESSVEPLVEPLVEKKRNLPVVAPTQAPAQTQAQPEIPKIEPNITTESQKEESKPVKRSRPQVLRPKLPKSGLETVIEDASSGKETLDLGDDTIESLQAIMDDPMVMGLKTEEEEEAAYEKEVLEKLAIARSNGSSSVDLDRLNEKLASLAKNINEVKKGLNNLEEHVSQSVLSSRPSSPTKVAEPTPHTTHNSESCTSCVSHSDGRLYAAIPLPQLWTKNPITRRRQLTKLGWVTLVSLSWYVIECMMIDQYCHPIMSDTCEGYCLQPDAPEFPWVTVTMMWRWSHLSSILMPIFTLVLAMLRLVAQLLGLWDGYVDEPGRLGNIIGEIRINGTPVSFPWLTAPEPQGVPIPIPPPSPPSQQQKQHQPVWTPTPRNDAPVKFYRDDDQPSIDDDEYL